MATFEIDDSEDVKLLRIKSDAETLVKGKGLHGLHAEDCSVTLNSNPTEKNKTRKVVAWILSIVAMVVAACLIKLLGFN